MGASAPVVYGLALSTPDLVAQRLADALTRHRKRIGTRWHAYQMRQQTVLTCA